MYKVVYGYHGDTGAILGSGDTAALAMQDALRTHNNDLPNLAEHCNDFATLCKLLASVDNGMCVLVVKVR